MNKESLHWKAQNSTFISVEGEWYRVEYVDPDLDTFETILVLDENSGESFNIHLSEVTEFWGLVKL